MALMKKFGVPFSGAADEEFDAEGADKAAPFKADQVDESRLGAMKGDAKYSDCRDFTNMQKTMKAADGFIVMKPMENF